MSLRSSGLRTNIHVPAARSCPSFALSVALKEERAQGVPDAGRTREACVQRKCTLRTQATTGQPNNRHSLRNGVTAYTWSPRCARAFWPPSPCVRHARLDPSVGGSGPHDFAVRFNPFVFAIPRPGRNVHRSPPPTLVTTAKRPCGGGGIWRENHIFPKNGSRIF